MKNRKNVNEYWLYGKHVCVSLLKNKNRLIKKILVTKQNCHIIPQSFSDKMHITTNEKITEVLKTSTVHSQGIAVLTNHLIQPSLDSFLSSKQEKSSVVILDQVTDPQNIGSIFRSAAAFAIDGVISTTDNCPNENQGILKAAAGTFELLPFVKVINLVQAIDKLKKNGYWICGLDGDAEHSINDELTTNILKNDKIALVLGSEDSGIRNLTRKHCDLIFKIPMHHHVQSLNVSCATAIALSKIYIA